MVASNGKSSPEKPKPLTPPPRLLLPDLNSPSPDQQPPTFLGLTDEDIAAAVTLSSLHIPNHLLNPVYELSSIQNTGFDDTELYYLGFYPQGYYESVKNKRIRTFLDSNEEDPKGKRRKLDDDDQDSNDDIDNGNSSELLVEVDFLANFENNQNSDGNGGVIDGDEDDDDDIVNEYYYVYDRDAYDLQERRRYASRYGRPSPPPRPPTPSFLPLLELEFGASPNPFYTAFKTIQERIKKRKVTWVSRRNERERATRLSVPSLLDLSFNVLANHADALVSLDGVADELKHSLSRLLCDSKRFNAHFLQLLLTGSPIEIRITDCSCITEEQFLEYFRTFDTARLEVLQLDLCGRCISDYTLHATLAQSPSYLPRLISLSLRGSCRLTDRGLHVLLSCTPALRSINLSSCSLLTYAGLNTLADSLGSLLKELYLDDCLHIDAALTVPALKRLEHLEVLSLGGLQTVSDEFIKDYIIACGRNMKELVLSDCINLTDASLKVIGEHCPELHALDLSNLGKLTDLSIGYLTNSCQQLHTLKLCRTPFSDEAIAAFLETTGKSLTELSLNYISKVGQQTALSLASHAKILHTLDLSWCRILTDNDFGLIVDSCSSLRFLKIFGCSKVTDFFLKGHSNPEIQIVGSKTSPLLPHFKVAPQEVLRYSSVSVDFDVISKMIHRSNTLET